MGPHSKSTTPSRPAARNRYSGSGAAHFRRGQTAARVGWWSNDFQATVLHLLGIDHQKLVYHANGRAQHLIDNRPARVVSEILV